MKAVFEGQTFRAAVPFSRECGAAEFSSCVFRGCDLSGYTFTAALFADCTFLNCDLSHVKVQACRFRRVTFEDCKLVGVSFTGVQTFLLDWTFKKCKVELCSFDGLKMKNTRFLECSLKETDFAHADLTGADFTGSDLILARFQHTTLVKANLTGAFNYAIDPSANRLKQARFSFPEVLSLLAPFDIKVE